MIERLNWESPSVTPVLNSAQSFLRTIEDEIAAKRGENKPRVSLVPSSLIYAVARQMEYGAGKHGLHDWKKGLPWTERIDSALRHLLDFKERRWKNDIDPDSRLKVLWGAATQIAMLIEYETTHPELDDR